VVQHAETNRVMLYDRSSDAWDRRVFSYCKPTDGSRQDARRFLKEFIHGAMAHDADDQFLMSDVFTDDDAGGHGPNAPAGALTAAQQGARVKRHRKAAAVFLKYIINNPSLSQSLREAHPQDGHAMLELFRVKCDIPHTALTIADTKTEVLSSTLLGTVGFKIGSIANYELAITQLNNTIEPAQERLDESALCVHTLRAIGDAAPVLKLECDKELLRPAAARMCVHVAGGGQWSLQAVVRSFGMMWDAQVKGGGIPERAPSQGKQRTVGNSRGDRLGMSSRYDDHGGYA
jgi:hypothetical protein